MRVIIAGGGTGGHLFPGIALADEFKRRSAGSDVLFVGTEKGIEARVLPKLGWPVRFISAEGIKGKGVGSKVRAIMKLIPGLFSSVQILRTFKPDIVIGVGGYASAPLLAAARLLNIRTAIHEQNALPGVTNRSLGKIVDRVFVSFTDSSAFFPAWKVMVSGNPLRKEILEGFKKEVEVEVEGKKSLLIFGGSLGAHRINMAALEMVNCLDDARNWKIVHQTGEKDFEEVKEGYRKAGLEVDVRQFIDDMTSAYREADLVICRAGATTIAELAASGKSAILIPYPYAADDHQRVNAESLVKTDGALMILEKDLTGERLASEVKRLMGDRALLKGMGDRARWLSRPDAARVIVDECYQLVVQE